MSFHAECSSSLTSSCIAHLCHR